MDLMTYLKAFIVGGLICVVAQILIDKTKITPARILVLFVLAGAVLSAVGLYEPLVKFAGAGATVPISGFGHLMVTGVKEAIQKYGILGILSGGLIASGAGVAAVIFFSYVAALCTKSKDKSIK